MISKKSSIFYSPFKQKIKLVIVRILVWKKQCYLKKVSMNTAEVSAIQFINYGLNLLKPRSYKA